MQIKSSVSLKIIFKKSSKIGKILKKSSKMIKHQIEPKNIFFQFLNKIIWQFINKILGFMQINASISPKTIFKKIRKIAKNFLKSNWTGQQFSWFFNIFFQSRKRQKKKNHLKKKKEENVTASRNKSEEIFVGAQPPASVGLHFEFEGPGRKLLTTCGQVRKWSNRPGGSFFFF